MPLRPVERQTRTSIRRFREGAFSDDTDLVAAEEPMETRVAWQEDGSVRTRRVAITMRTPGRDFALAVGFLFAEGVIAHSDDIVDVSYCAEAGDVQRFNIVTVTLRPGLVPDLDRLERTFAVNSSCGVCGRASIESLDLRGSVAPEAGVSIKASVLTRLPDALRQNQSLFATTGGLHAAGLFACDGQLRAVEEDIGRHNAVDKLVGAALLDDRDVLDDCVLMLSGRASFELLQKALAARISLVAAVGAPSSLAVEVAATFGITLAGFVRGEGFNLYAGAHRVKA